MRINPWIEVPVNSSGIAKIAMLARLWNRSYLYRTDSPKRVLLSKAELDQMDENLVAVLGPMTRRETHAFLTDELIGDVTH